MASLPVRVPKEPDFLDEMIAEGTAQDPAFGTKVEAGTQARVIIRHLVEQRRRLGLSQADVAARTGTQQSAIARMETGGRDPKLWTVLSYAAAVGMLLEPVAAQATKRPPGRPGKTRVRLKSKV